MLGSADVAPLNWKTAMLNESGRLAENQRTLLETLPGIVLVVTSDGTIEYLNPPAEKFFGNSKSSSLKEKRVKELQRGLVPMLSEERPEPRICKIGKQLFECHIAPFGGYKGDRLSWVILKSASETKTTSTPDLPGTPAQENRLIGSSPVMQKLQKLSERFAKTDITTLITGESGTGKELIANLVQQNSSRKDKPFLAINCNTINDLLLESDLFGYEKGAFTGANSRKTGKFEAVDGGTIFLDEIGDISPRMQSALLRVLQHGEIILVGGTAPIKVDVRVIAATNRDLPKDVKEGKFRLDLFYRLSIVKIVVPPLRDRKEDLAELVDYFINKYCSLFGIDIKYDSDSILQKLVPHDWPGNVRELENVIQRAILSSDDGTLSADAISFDTSSEEEHVTALSSVVKTFNGTPLKKIVDQIEKEVILKKLELSGGNVANTAEKLDICKAALYEKMKRYGISAKTSRDNR